MSQPFAALDERSARRYEAWYATATGRQMAAAEEALLAVLLDSLPACRTVLEVGCGTGHFARWLAAQGLTVVGLDPAAAMLDVAAELGGGPNYALGRAEELPFRDGRFDLVAFVTSLEFMVDPAAALREARRVARRGLLLGVLNAASPLGVARKAQAIFRPSPYRRARFYSPWALARLVRRALGGEVQRLECRTTIWPGWAPGALRRLPFGAFIGMAVSLKGEGNG